MKRPLREYCSPHRFNLQVSEFKTDLVVKLQGRATPGKGGGHRSDITELTRASIKRLKFRLRNGETEWKTLVTLTYPAVFPTDGRKVKRHLNAFLQWLRRQEGRYCWALEFQRRHAPHIHIIVDRYLDIDEAKERWWHIVGSGDEMHRGQGVQVDAIRGTGEDRARVVGYLISYLKKADQKTVPAAFDHVGRFWGGSREIIQEVCRVALRATEGEARRALRIVRKWYERKMKSWGFSWYWRRQQGFVMWGGAEIWDKLLSSGQINFKEVYHVRHS